MDTLRINTVHYFFSGWREEDNKACLDNGVFWDQFNFVSKERVKKMAGMTRSRADHQDDVIIMTIVISKYIAAAAKKINK